jgi:hypothetical protein
MIFSLQVSHKSDLQRHEPNSIAAIHSVTRRNFSKKVKIWKYYKQTILSTHIYTLFSYGGIYAAREDCSVGRESPITLRDVTKLPDILSMIQRCNYGQIKDRLLGPIRGSDRVIFSCFFLPRGHLLTAAGI